MANPCVSCGDVAPEGSWVCYACSNGGLKCPDCGATLRFMVSSKFNTVREILFFRLYHCENCLADWETDYSVDNSNYTLHRKFWG